MLNENPSSQSAGCTGSGRSSRTELAGRVCRLIDPEFLKTRTEGVGTATELIADMAETETTPNVVTKYLGQFYYEVLEPAGIEYRTKRTGQSRLIKFIRRDGGDANDGNITV